jgi:hypothetical protein
LILPDLVVCIALKLNTAATGVGNPSGGIGTAVIILIVLLLMGRI